MPSETITYNVGGQHIELERSFVDGMDVEVLTSALATTSNKPVFIDANPTVFLAVLNFLRDEESIVLPDSISKQTFVDELSRLAIGYDPVRIKDSNDVIEMKEAELRETTNVMRAERIAFRSRVNLEKNTVKAMKLKCNLQTAYNYQLEAQVQAETERLLQQRKSIISQLQSKMATAFKESFDPELPLVEQRQQANAFLATTADAIQDCIVDVVDGFQQSLKQPKSAKGLGQAVSTEDYFSDSWSQEE